MCAYGGWEAWAIIRQCVEMDRAICERDLPVFVFPGHRVLQPVLVIPLVIILACMRSAGFCAFTGGMSDHHRLVSEVCQLKRGKQADIPQERVIVDSNVLERIAQAHELVHALLQNVPAAEHAE